MKADIKGDLNNYKCKIDEDNNHLAKYNKNPLTTLVRLRPSCARTPQNSEKYF